MSVFTTRAQITHVADSESEAKAIIEEAKKNHIFTLLKSSTERKQIKAKGEVISEYYKVVLLEEFTPEKEPDKIVSIHYDCRDYFPPAIQKDDDIDDEEEEE